MDLKSHIPNAITCLSLFCGCMACTAALRGQLRLALVWIVAAAVFDFSDGLAARLLRAYSPMGKELDSLSDLVGFGVAPGMMLFYLLTQAVSCLSLGVWSVVVPCLAFVIPVFSALRLAKFNLDTRQTTSFIGMPVPAHALLWASLCCAVYPLVSAGQSRLVILLAALAVATSLLLVSPLPMFSFKVSSVSWKGNELRYLLLACALVFLCLWGVAGIAATIGTYLLLSLAACLKK